MKRSRFASIAVVAAVVVLLAAPPVGAAAGDLDTGFGTGGVAFADVASTYNGARAVAVDSAGRTIAAGFAHADDGIDQDVMVARYLPSGALDPSFGSAGVVTSNVAPFDAAYAVAVAPDGRPVVAGSASGPDGSALLVVRYDDDGSLDSTFGTGGVVTAAIGMEATAFAVAIASDGAVTVAGRSTVAAPTCCSSVGLVMRLLPSGAFDRTFGDGDGIVTVPLTTAYAVAVIGANTTAVGEAGGDMGAVRLRADGSLDPTFGGGDGLVTVDFDAHADEARAVVPQPQGRVVLAGTACHDPGNLDDDCDVGLVRLQRDGALDVTFGRAGRAVADLGGRTGERGLSAAAAGDDVFVGGETQGPSGTLDLFVAKFGRTGRLDRRFGSSGVAYTDIAGQTDEAGGIALDPSGRVVAAGTAGVRVADFSMVAARYLTSRTA